MRRRALLRAGAAAVALPIAGRVDGGGRDRPYRPLGHVTIPRAREVVVSGDHAFVATGDGFAVVDVGDPGRPTVVATETAIGADKEGGPLADVWDLKTWADRLVLAGPALPDLDGLHGFAVYDVADPAAPELLGFRETVAAIHNCFAADGRVYVPETDRVDEALLIFAVRDDGIEQLGEWSIVDHESAFRTVYHGLYQLHDLRVRDDRAYLAHWDAGVYVLDVSDPSAPEYVTHFGGRSADALQATTGDGGEEIGAELAQLPGNVHSVVPSADGRLLAVGRESWDLEPGDGRGGPGGIELWDVADIGTPRRLATIDAPPSPDQSPDGSFTTAHNFDLAGGRLYSAWYHGGVRIHDVADPADPHQLTWWQRPSEAAFWTARPADAGDDFFVATDYGLADTHEDAGLYTFPDRPAPGESPASAGIATPTARPTATPTPMATPSPTPSATPTTTPGVGPTGALAGLGLAAWWRFRLRER